MLLTLTYDWSNLACCKYYQLTTSPAGYPCWPTYNWGEKCRVVVVKTRLPNEFYHQIYTTILNIKISMQFGSSLMKTKLINTSVVNTWRSHHRRGSRQFIIVYDNKFLIKKNIYIIKWSYIFALLRKLRRCIINVTKNAI